MADDEKPSSKSRRVYDLPNELVDRVVEFQKDRKLPSEVEAVRKLLDLALKSRDTVEMLVGRLLQSQTATMELSEVAGAVLSGHPSVRAIEFLDNAVGFVFRRGDGAETRVVVQNEENIGINSSGLDFERIDRRWFYDHERPVGERLVDPENELPF